MNQINQENQNQITEQKWNMLDDVINEVKLVQHLSQNQGVTQQQKEIAQLQEKLQKIKNLKKKVEGDDKTLKLEYLILMRERNVYFEKLKMIQTVGDNNNWNDESGLLLAIRNLLSNLGENNKDESQIQQ